jgi:hypothetical protein
MEHNLRITAQDSTARGDCACGWNKVFIGRNTRCNVGEAWENHVIEDVCKAHNHSIVPILNTLERNQFNYCLACEDWFYPLEPSHNHNKDADCSVDPATDMCTVCGVYHGEACDECGGRGFHGDACSLNEANWVDAQETRENSVDLDQFKVKDQPAIDANELSQAITDGLAESSSEFSLMLAEDEGAACKLVESTIRQYCLRHGIEVR